MDIDKNQKVAYFSMEVGITSKIPSYSGGLGVLAGDLLKAAADMHFPMVGVTLLNKYGYFFQEIEEGRQIEEPVLWRIDDFLKPVEEKVVVTINNHPVTIGCWMTMLYGSDGFMVPLYFLHTDLPENTEEDKNITDFLYGDGSNYRFQQEIILGVGGFRMLQKLGYNTLEKFHMNEGHSSLLALELLKNAPNKEDVKKKCIFTTHTPVPAGHDIFSMTMVQRDLEPDLFALIPESYKQKGELNMTELALDNSDYINGVAQKHQEVSKSMFPEHMIHAITNGVHAQSWVSPHMAYIYDRNMPEWRRDPANLKQISKVSPSEIWNAHYEAKKQIIDFANAYSNAGLDYDFFTIGWARRFTSYKRPDFLLTDPQRLIEIAEKVGPIQIIYAGKAHPKDIEGKELIEKTFELIKQLRGKVTMVYIQNYDMYISKFLTSGVDVWLNTPMPPHEASGTSGMKAALNGIPHLSVLDGWWIEGCKEGETGWSFSTPNELYDLLQKTILPCFYNNREHWSEIMKSTILYNGSYFTSQRMLSEYIEKAYKMNNLLP